MNELPPPPISFVPKMQVPEFWLANFALVHDYLTHRVERGQVRLVGHSSLGYPIRVVEYPGKGPPLLIMGGTHGHESGTVAAVMNMVHLMETGRDLAGEPRDALARALAQAHLYLLPVLNPDGRVVNPDSGYALPVGALAPYANGLQKDGSEIPYWPDTPGGDPIYHFDPSDAMFMGGQFNGAGYAMNRRRSPDDIEAVEVAALVKFLQHSRVDAVADLHACNTTHGMQAVRHEPVYWPIMREWQRRAEHLFAETGRRLWPLGWDGDPPKSRVSYLLNNCVFHKHCQLMFITFEGQVGYVGRPDLLPLITEYEIIDNYLMMMQVFIELGIEGRYAAANRSVFGAVSS